MPRIIMHVDMDAFFAAIEQADFPEYRGKPVIVGADPQGGRGRGVVSTASYEARKFGIHSALPISQAYYRCPNGIFVRPRGKRYSEMSQKIMQIFQDFTPVIEPISIDEAFFDISGCLRLFGSSHQIALKLKQKILAETKLTASVGIAPNKFIAKIASDLEKPDGLVTVKAGEEKTFLKPLPISKMWGIGKKTEPLFHRMDIYTIGQIAETPPDKLVSIFGKPGLSYWQLANGVDNRPVQGHNAAKSVSHEVTFMEDTNDLARLEGILFQIAENLGRTLRKKKLKAKTVNLRIRLADFQTFTRSKSTLHHQNSSVEIRKIALNLLKQFNFQGQKVRLIGLGVSNFNVGPGEQMSFLNTQNEVKDQRIDQVIDLIEDRFGKGTIRKASLLQEVFSLYDRD